MQPRNQTVCTEFLLLGFQNVESFKTLFFLLLLAIHLMTVCGNLLIIWLVASNRSLQSPMYFFLTQLSLSDLLLTTDIVPNALYIIWNEGGAMSFTGCITQFYLFDLFECFLLATMAYDRYLAICNPLRYSSIMNSFLCIRLVILSWILSFSVALTDIISMTQLDFCGPNIIDHFFCDLAPLLELSCSDTTFFQVEIFILCTFVTLPPLIFVIVSYAWIVKAVLRISTKTGRGKAFSTCSSHLAVVSIFYGTLIGSYMIPANGKSLTVSKAVSLLYTVFTPMINPIIYSLKNKDIKGAMKRTFLLVQFMIIFCN
uniref:Olfactory receptor n=1 Tax=Leptobrachium leishanense TaxID=445787 RepID=A0A8C5M1I3_9ANUR